MSSGTCVMYSSLILRTDMFRDWPLLECSSCVSIETPTNFCLYLNIAIFLRGKVFNSSGDYFTCIFKAASENNGQMPFWIID